MNKYKDKKIIHIPIICEDCDEGIVEVGPICFRPASDCCGGCYEQRTCETCAGTGVIKIDEDNDEMNDTHLMYQSVHFRIENFTLLQKDIQLALNGSVIEADSSAFKSLTSQASLLHYEIIRHKALLERLYSDLMEHARNNLNL